MVKTVDEMWMNLPSAERAIAKRLRDLVQECLPFAIEKPYYGLGVPYYSRCRQICYIFPSSALRGKDDIPLASKGVTLGFCQGNQMSNDSGLLKAEGRKQVRVIHFSSLREIPETQVRAWLFEAALIDDRFRKKAGKG